MCDHKKLMRRAIELSSKNIEMGGGPFGAVVVKDGRIVGEGANRVTPDNDPTAHAEVVAIRDAARKLGTYNLSDCTIYTSCEPCPMCLGAIYWARINRMYYGNTKLDAEAAGFDDSLIYKEMAKPISNRQLHSVQMLRDEAQSSFKKWIELDEKTDY